MINSKILFLTVDRMRSLFCEFYRKKTSTLFSELKILLLIKATAFVINTYLNRCLLDYCLV